MTIDKKHEIDSDRPYIQSVMGRYGRCYYFRHDKFIGKSVFQYGEYSPEECDYIVNLANTHPGLVLDIGANIGCVSQALLSAGHKVVAFEPQPAIFELLVKNCPAAVCNNIALGSRTGTAQMPLVNYSKRDNFGGLGIGLGIGLGKGLSVEIRTLDSYNLSEVSLIKIDVEGFEEQVLRGSVETIARCKPILYLEADRKEKLGFLASFLTSIGYSYTPHHPPLFSPDNYFGNSRLAWEKNYVSKNWDCRYNGQK